MGFTEQEAYDTMASALESRGLASQDQIQADRVIQPFHKPAESTTTAVDTTNPQADAVNPAAALDRSIFAGPSSPDGYRFLPPPNGATRDVSQEQATAQAFHDIGLPASIANHADRLFSEAMLAPPNAEQIESARQQGHAQLTRQFGDNTAKVISVAQAEFTRMAAKAPHIKAMAEQSGLGNNPMLIASLYHNAVAKGRA